MSYAKAKEGCAIPVYPELGWESRRIPSAVNCRAAHFFLPNQT